MKEKRKACPYCKKAPITTKLELNDDYVVRCGTEGCRCQLYCMGKTRSLAEECWDRCIKEKDY